MPISGSNRTSGEEIMGKNPHAVALGCKGGLARLKTMTAKERSDRARHAVKVRESRRKKKELKAPSFGQK